MKILTYQASTKLLSQRTGIKINCHRGVLEVQLFLGTYKIRKAVLPEKEMISITDLTLKPGKLKGKKLCWFSKLVLHIYCE